MATTEKQKGKRGNIANLKPFKKGQSGNPKGRPKKELCITSLVKEEFEGQALDKDGIPIGMTKAQAFAKALVSHAIRGHKTAMKELLDRIDGKVPDEVNLNADVSHEATDRGAQVAEWMDKLDPETREKVRDAAEQCAAENE